jgi:multisubunit Na+/H+ antiporter MnhG subunit
MSTSEVIASALLVGALFAEVICVVGMLWFRSAFDGLHFAAAATSLAPLLVAVAAVLTGFSWVSGTIECVVACAVLFVLNPVIVAATGRAARLEEYGDLGYSGGAGSRS